jgi:ABC-type sugar transport system permease subunit
LLLKTGLIQKGVPWLGQTTTALLCVIISRAWQMLPWYMAFLLGGLQGVSHEQVEAARIDGANNIQVFRHVVLPGMRQIVNIVLVLGAIGNLQHFDIPWTMTQGGPARATMTFSLEVYTTAFKNWKIGTAATIGTIWAILLLVFNIVYLKQWRNRNETSRYVPAKRRFRIFFLCFAILIGAFVFLPLLWMVNTAVKPMDKTFTLSFFTGPLTLDNLIGILKNQTIMRYLRNSLLVSFASSFAATVVSAISAYSFSKFRYTGRKFIMGMFMMSQAFPRRFFCLPFI